MLALWLALADASGAAYVLHSDSVRRLARAVRAAQRADLDRVVALSSHTVCVELDEPSPKQLLRLARRLGHPPEARLTCDVAWFPLGRGWIALLVEPPAEGLAVAIQAIGVPASQVTRSLDGSAPVRVCASRAAVGDPVALAAQLEDRAYDVLGVYEVGGCVRP